jgi:hypothetical protein
MAIGSSGRIVIEVEPELKHLLHAALREEGLTLKDWFTDHARRFLYEDKQLALDFSGGEARQPSADHVKGDPHRKTSG